MRIDDSDHPWLLLKDRQPSGFYPDETVADWAPVDLSDGEIAGYLTFARHFRPEAGT